MPAYHWFIQATNRETDGLEATTRGSGRSVVKKSLQETLGGTVARLFVVALCLAAAQGAAEAAKGVCVSAEIEETFRLPDGSDHPAGRLTLCHHSDYSPVASFHRTKVDGMTVSMHLSRRGESERGDSDAPFMMFTREGDGTLLLLGYGHAGQDQAAVHAFQRNSKPRQMLQAKARTAESETPIIRLAASLD
jgi:hypothetical protein